MRVSVIIRCYNEERHIGRLLDGLVRQTLRDLEIVAVDSGSTDGTLDVLSRYPVEVVRIAKEDFSFGRSLNLGCRRASGDVLVLASAHVYPVYDDWLERLTSPFADDSVALAYGKQRGAEATRFSEHRIFRSWFPDASNPNQIHPFCNNANAAVRRSVWNKLPYDESLTGLEDIAWAKQAMALGHRIVYEADAEIVHLHEERFPQIFNRYRREAMAMKAIFPESRFGLGSFARLWAANTLSDWRAAAREGRLGQALFDVPSFRLAQFLGAWRGHAQHGPVTERLRMHLYYPGAEEGAESADEAGRRRATRIQYGFDLPLGPVEEAGAGDP